MKKLVFILFTLLLTIATGFLFFKSNTADVSELSEISDTHLYDCKAINKSGTYYLLNDVLDHNGTCFEIQTSNVILDCQGHVIDGNFTGYGIYVSAYDYGNISNITIRNCNVQEFSRGIFYFGNFFEDFKEDKNKIENSVIKNVIVHDNSESGIHVSVVSSITLTNIIANNNHKYGIYLAHALYNNTLMNITTLFNGEYDIYLSHDRYLSSILPEDCSAITMQNITGTGNLPILYYNTSVNLADMHVAELILCNASYSNLTNITIGGFENNALLMFHTHHSALNRINSSNNYQGILLDHSSFNNLFNIIANNNHENGISLDHALYNILTYITASSNNESGIDLLVSKSNVLANIIANNNQYGIDLSVSPSNNTLTNINASYNDKYDIYLSYFIFEDCSTITMQNITGTGNLPILFINKPTNLADMHVAELILCYTSYSNLTNITVGGFGNNMLYLFYTRYSNLNRINSSNNYQGILLDHSSFNNLFNIIANNNHENGISLDHSFSNILTNVTANSNHRAGIYAQYSSFTMANSSILNNRDYDIYCYDIYCSNYSDFDDPSYNNAFNTIHRGDLRYCIDSPCGGGSRDFDNPFYSKIINKLYDLLRELID